MSHNDLLRIQNLKFVPEKKRSSTALTWISTRMRYTY